MIERPVSFTVKRKHIAVYPTTLGKLQLVARLLDIIGINDEALRMKGNAEFLLLQSAEEHRDECLRLIAYSTLPGAECLDENKVYERLLDLQKLDSADIATLLLLILTRDKTKEIQKQYFMDKEAENMDKVMRVKKQDRSTLSFGGRSVWGTLIDTACERYGWSYQYVLWGISYANLQLLFADQIRTVYLTDEERKQVRIPNDGLYVRAEDAATMEQIIKTQSWK